MKFGITTLLTVTSVAALFSAILFGDPLMGIGFLIIVVPTIVGLAIAAYMARYVQSADNEPISSPPQPTKKRE